MKKVKKKDCPKWKSLEPMRLRFPSESTFMCLVDVTKMAFWTHANGNFNQNKIYCDLLYENNKFFKFLWFSFDTENNSWESIKSMNVGRQHLTAAALNENIYISGGKIKIDPLSKSNSVELYDPETDEWKNVAPMNKYRGRSELVAFNGFLYAMGDFSSGIDRFDPLENSWKEVWEWNSKRWLNSLTENFIAFQIGHYSGASFANLIESNGRLFAITQIGTFYKINIFDREFRRNVSLSGSNQCKITVNSLGESNYKAGGGCYFLFHV